MSVTSTELPGAGAPLRVILRIARVPASVNAGGGGSRQHWSKAHEEKMGWERDYRVLLLEQQVPFGMTRCVADAIIRWAPRDKRGHRRHVRADIPNYILAVAKPLGDVLSPPRSLYHTTGGRRTAIPNTAPRWLPDDTDEFFHWDRLRFEYPSDDDWLIADPRVRGELVVNLLCFYA